MNSIGQITVQKMARKSRDKKSTVQHIKNISYLYSTTVLCVKYVQQQNSTVAS